MKYPEDTMSQRVSTGMLSGIFISPERRGPMQSVQSCRFEAGRGLVGDRCYTGNGSYQGGDPANRCISMIDLFAIGRAKWRPIWTRRNLIVSPTGEDGREPMDFTWLLEQQAEIWFGQAHFKVTGYCTPCRVPDSDRQKAVGRSIGDESFTTAFAGTGGLLLRPLNDGELQVGDSLYHTSRGY